MPDRHFPVRPDLDQLKHQAKDLLRKIRRGEPAAELAKHHPERSAPRAAKLADAQLVLARSYGIASWPRLVQACRLIDAIWRDDADAVRRLVTRHPALLHEDARGVKGNWGPPMSYAANLGRDRIIAMLRELGAADVQFAFDRACLQGKLETARKLYAMGARPLGDCVMGPAETQNGPGMALLFELLDQGADPSARASLRKRLRFVEDESTYEYRDVTPLLWGERFQDQDWVNRKAMQLIAERGGRA